MPPKARLLGTVHVDVAVADAEAKIARRMELARTREGDWPYPGRRIVVMRRTGMAGDLG
jgi:hypothetical protein